MTLTNPAHFISLRLTQRAGPAPSISRIWKQDWEKGQKAALLPGQLKIPLIKDLLFQSCCRDSS